MTNGNEFFSVMTIPRSGAATGSILDTAEEESGLSAVVGTGAQTLAREQATGDAAVLQAARDALTAAFRERPQFLDPFAPAAERNAEVLMVLRAAIQEARQRGGPLARVPNDHETLIQLFAQTLGWGPAQRYLDDERVNEVKIVGRRIRVQEAGQPFVTVGEAFHSADEVQSRAVLLASVLGVRLDAETPQATLPVAHGTRMHVSIPPRTVDGALVCIRRGRREAWDLDDVLRRGTLDAGVAELLTLLSRARCSMLIAGRTGSGKTGLLEALANSWPGDPHTVTIEDHTMEIGIRRADAWTRELVDTQRDPLAFRRVAREALRQTPDLLLPGEIRGNEAGAILALVGGVAQHRAQVGRQQFRLERLDQEVNRANAEGPPPEFPTRRGGQEKHRGAGGAGIGFQPPADLEPVHAGHDHVEDHGVERFFGRQAQRRRAIRSGRYVKTGAAELLAQQKAQGRFIVYDQDTLGLLTHRFTRSPGSGAEVV